MSTSSGPYNLKVIDSCFGCTMREEGIFCRLSQSSLSQLNSHRMTAFYPRGAIIFAQGESPRGLFIFCSGQAKLVSTSKDGQSITFRRVEHGEAVGLSNVISNEPYLASAETLEPSQVSFIPRLVFLQFLRANPDASLNVAKHLSMELHKAWEQTNLLALAPSTQAKLAQFLLARGAQDGRETAEGVQIALKMTHDEIAHSIGASRESVTRVLSDFRNRRLIRVVGSALIILQTTELQTLIAGLLT